MKVLRMSVNWFLFWTCLIWMPLVFFFGEIAMFFRILFGKNKKCHNWRALFGGTVWFVTWKDIKSLFVEDENKK